MRLTCHGPNSGGCGRIHRDPSQAVACAASHHAKAGRLKLKSDRSVHEAACPSIETGEVCRCRPFPWEKDDFPMIRQPRACMRTRKIKANASGRRP